MRISAVQLRVSGDQRAADRLAAVRQSVADEAARGADLVVLPEMWPVGYFAFDDYAGAGEPLDGPLGCALSEAAAAAGVYLAAGSMVERDGDKLCNTTLLYDRAGTLTASYRKIHLFGYGSKEQQILTPGTDVVVTTIDGMAVGLSTCYDLRFPELYRRMVDAGAELFVVVAGWPFPRVDAWRCLARARAIENQAALVGCNAAGSQGGSTFAGASVAFNAWGTPLGELDDRPGVLRVDIDAESIRAARADFPALADRRLREGT
jgi:predicted amidohydrolase